MNFRGEGILGNPLLCFQKKVIWIREEGEDLQGFPLLALLKNLSSVLKEQGCPLKQKKSIFYRGQKIYSLYYLLWIAATPNIYKE